MGWLRRRDKPPAEERVPRIEDAERRIRVMGDTVYVALKLEEFYGLKAGATEKLPEDVTDEQVRETVTRLVERAETELQFKIDARERQKRLERVVREAADSL